MRTLFISDIHLSPTRPQLTHALIDFLEQQAMNAEALYILGDLFDFWIGDDDQSEFATQILNALKAVADSGVKCCFVSGNRDFLVGRGFARRTGFQLLDEVSKIDLYGTPTVILHGDTLCLEDIGYLAFRTKVRQPWLQWLFNRLPFVWRRKIVARVQISAKSEKSTKSYDIMDVTQQEVVRVMNENQVNLMIHGHTHRPDIHSFEVQQQQCTRVVLGDWGKNLSYFEVKPDGYQLISCKIE